MTNFSDTLQRVLAEFRAKFVKLTSPSTLNSRMNEMMKEMEVLTVRKPKAIEDFISQALTESLKEAFAAIEVEKADKCYDGYPEEGLKAEGWNMALQAIEEKKTDFWGK